MLSVGSGETAMGVITRIVRMGGVNPKRSRQSLVQCVRLNHLPIDLPKFGAELGEARYSHNGCCIGMGTSGRMAELQVQRGLNCCG